MKAIDVLNNHIADWSVEDKAEMFGLVLKLQRMAFADQPSDMALAAFQASLLDPEKAANAYGAYLKGLTEDAK